MKKIDLGQTISVIANLGVIAGIALLAVELNQNNALLRNEARYNLQEARSAELDQFALYPELSEAWYKAIDNQPLSVSERRQVVNALGARIVRWEWYYEQYRNGLIEEDVLPLQAWRVVLANSVMQEMWAERAQCMSPDFVQFIEDSVIGQ